jgi:hypothetical protein
MRYLTLALFLFVTNAEAASLGIDVNWGFYQGKGIFLDETASTLGDTKSGSMWEYVSIELVSGRDSIMTSYGLGIAGVSTKSSVLFLGGIATLDAKAYTFTLWGTRYISEIGEKTRMYIQAGPSVSNLDLALSAGGVSVTDKQWKAGFGAGVGASHKMNKIALLFRVRYSFVATDGTYDPSAFTATVGLGFGG